MENEGSKLELCGPFSGAKRGSPEVVPGGLQGSGSPVEFDTDILFGE